MKSLLRAIPFAFLLTAAGCLDGESGTDVSGPLGSDKHEDNRLPDTDGPGLPAGTGDPDGNADPDNPPLDRGPIDPNPPSDDPDPEGLRVAPECETIEVPEGSCRRVMCAEKDGPVVEMAACNI